MTNPFTKTVQFNRALEGAYKTKVTNIGSYIKNDRGGYIQVTFEVNNRELKQNILSSQVEYFVNLLSKKLDKPEGGYNLIDLLEELKTTPIELHWSYNKGKYNSYDITANPRVTKESTLEIAKEMAT